MGFWHTGYEEFHEPGGLGDFVFTPSPPKRFHCDQCSVSFADLERLRRHRFESHPLRQPALIVRGQSVGKLPFKVMNHLQPTDVVVEDALICRINGELINSDELVQRLTMYRRQFLEVELSNSGVVTRCALDFCIPELEDLNGVETAFLRMVQNRTLTVETIARFNQDCKVFQSANLYAHGISQYLYGVMAKERSVDSGLSVERYKEKFIQSDHDLTSFDRVLSNSIRALIAFHFNHFSEAQDLAPLGALKHASAAFLGLLEGKRWQFPEVPVVFGLVEELLTDQDTRVILIDSSHGLDQLKSNSQGLLFSLGETTAGYDNLKRSLLAFEAMLLSGDVEFCLQARQIASRLMGASDTNVWAESFLKRLGKL